MSLIDNYNQLKKSLPENITLVAVSKTHSFEKILELHNATGHLDFGENKVQELCGKYEQLPKNIQWHLIGHLQSNKVKYIAPFVHLIHSVDSEKLLQEINKQAKKCNRIIPVLLQIYIATEETKFGLSFTEAEELLLSSRLQNYSNIRINGFMGMASNTENMEQVKSEFSSLRKFFQYANINFPKNENVQLNTLSIGMSHDYNIAIESGSNMIRVGSLIFGERSYKTQ